MAAVDCLYHPDLPSHPQQTRGFFNAKVPPVGTLLNPINYWKIYCKAELDVVISKKYKELEVSLVLDTEICLKLFATIQHLHHMI